MKASANPTVDVIIPGYKQAQYIGQAIDSVLGQTYPHVTAIVVDDGSPDETSAVAAGYGDRIVYIRQENAGVSAARNTGILASTAGFLLFLDGDDYLQVDAVEQHIEQARAHPEASVFHGTVEHVDAAGRSMGRGEAQSLGRDVFHALLEGNCLAIGSMMIRRSAFSRAGLFNGAVNDAEDWDLWLRLAATGSRFVPVPKAVAMYRHHPTNVSKTSARSWLAGCAVLKASKIHHGECRLCQRARSRGKRRLRNWCFYLLTEQMDAALNGRDLWAGVTLGLRSPVVRAPHLAPQLIEEFCRYARRSVVTIARGPAGLKRPVNGA